MPKVTPTVMPKVPKNALSAAVTTVFTLVTLGLLLSQKNGREGSPQGTAALDPDSLALAVNNTLLGVSCPAGSERYESAAQAVSGRFRHEWLYDPAVPVGNSLIGSPFNQPALDALIGRRMPGEQVSEKGMSDVQKLAVFVERQYPQVMCPPGGTNHKGEGCRSEAIDQMAALRGAALDGAVMSAMSSGNKPAQRAAIRGYLAREFLPGLVVTHLLRGLFAEVEAFAQAFNPAERKRLSNYGQGAEREEQKRLLQNNPTFMKAVHELAACFSDQAIDGMRAELGGINVTLDTRIRAGVAEYLSPPQLRQHNNPGPHRGSSQKPPGPREYQQRHEQWQQRGRGEGNHPSPKHQHRHLGR